MTSSSTQNRSLTRPGGTQGEGSDLNLNAETTVQEDPVPSPPPAPSTWPRSKAPRSEPAGPAPPCTRRAPNSEAHAELGTWGTERSLTPVSWQASSAVSLLRAQKPRPHMSFCAHRRGETLAQLQAWSGWRAESGVQELPRWRRVVTVPSGCQAPGLPAPVAWTESALGQL